MKNFWYEKILKKYSQSIREIEDESIKSILSRIKEDKELSEKNIFSYREKDGSLVFRIDLSLNRIFEISPLKKKEYPEIYEGMQVPKDILKKIVKNNEENKKHYMNRILIIEEEIKRREDKNFSAIENIINENNLNIINIINREILLENASEDYIEKLSYSSNIMERFIASVLYMRLYLLYSKKINHVFCENIAESIANYEVFGYFDGEDRERIRIDLDFIPTKKEYLFKNNNPKFLEFSKKGIFIYDNYETKQFSEKFKELYGDFIEKSHLVKTIKEKIIKKVENIAMELV